MWPNSSLNSLLTYWDRKSVAQVIGKGGVSDILLRLDLITQRNPNNTLLVTGHSFGGAVLVSAINEILLHRMIVKRYPVKEDDAKEELRYFSDGVVLLNPAVEANQMLQTFELAREISEKHKGRNSLITIISSEDDKANKILFPVGQFLDTIFYKHKRIYRKYSPKKLSERKLDTTTVGNYKPFHTGNLIDNKTIEANSFLEKFFSERETSLSTRKLVSPQSGTILSSSPETGANLAEWLYVDCCEDPQACILSNEDSNILCDKPFPLSFVYTDKTFIGSHTDVFNNNVLAYLAAGTTGTMLYKLQQYQEPQEPSGLIFRDTQPQTITEKCLKGDQFDFSECFKFYYGALKNADEKCEEKSSK